MYFVQVLVSPKYARSWIESIICIDHILDNQEQKVFLTAVHVNLLSFKANMNDDTLELELDLTFHPK